MKLLIGSSPSKLYFNQEIAEALAKFNIETRVVVDSQICDGFPSTKISSWFQSESKFRKLIDEFKPDAILADRQRHFCLAAAKTKLPLFMLLRGNIWAEIDSAREMHRSFPARIAISRWEKMAEQCFPQSTAIIPVCRYLENIVKEHHPRKPIHVLHNGIEPSRWYPVEPMNLKHPCVGLLQMSWVWEKAKEMLTLTKAIESMPEVMFYWAGDGPLRKNVLDVLGKYENFKWLGPLQYPDKVREYLAGIDVYALPSGLDMAPATLQQAQLMEKPVVATNVGGIPELMDNNKTGFLVEKGDYQGWIEKLSILINDTAKARQMGTAGRKFVTDNFGWHVIGKRLAQILEDHIAKPIRD